MVLIAGTIVQLLWALDNGNRGPPWAASKARSNKVTGDFWNITAKAFSSTPLRNFRDLDDRGEEGEQYEAILARLATFGRVLILDATTSWEWLQINTLLHSK